LTAAVSEPTRLPLWRAILGFGALGIFFVVLLALSPAYLQNYRLTGRVKAVVASSSELTLGKLTPGELTPGPAEDALRQKLLTEAHTLGLPVLPGDIHFTRTPQALEVRIRYIVHQSLGLYHVDLHFHPSARTALR